MNILILGYGKMGKIISQMAEERGHRIVAKINIENVADLDHLDTNKHYLVHATWRSCRCRYYRLDG